MSVTAKFFVTTITHHHTTAPNDVAATVKLAPVYGDENKPWSKYTPQGEISMMITNPAAIEQFSLGQKFLIEFTPSE